MSISRGDIQHDSQEGHHGSCAPADMAARGTCRLKMSRPAVQRPFQTVPADVHISDYHQFLRAWAACDFENAPSLNMIAAAGGEYN
jgi:hypothetical protein